MTAPVPGYLNLRDFVDEYLLHSAGRCFLVTQDSHVMGLVTPAETRSVSREDWPQTSVQSVMRRLDQLQAVPPDMSVVKALELMSRDNITQLPVVSDGKLQGIFSRNQLLRFLHIYSGIETERDRAA